jgi:hypothetical protein
LLLRNLHSRLLIAFGVLIIIPMAAAGLYLYMQTEKAMETQAMAMQEELVQRVSSEFNNFIGHHVRSLDQLIRVRGLVSMDAQQRQSLLAEMLAFGRQFEELALLDTLGNEIAVVHRYRLIVPEEFGSRAEESLFNLTLQKRGMQFGAVHFHYETGEPLMEVAIPIFRNRDGGLQSVLIAQLRLKYIWNLLASMPVQRGQIIYILDKQYKVVAHPNPSVVLRSTQLFSFAKNSTTGLNGGQVIRASRL